MDRYGGPVRGRSRRYILQYGSEDEGSGGGQVKGRGVGFVRTIVHLGEDITVTYLVQVHRDTSVLSEVRGIPGTPGRTRWGSGGKPDMGTRRFEVCVIVRKVRNTDMNEKEVESGR